MKTSISIAEYKNFAKKPNKYRNVKCNGKDSKKEYHRIVYLRYLEEIGEITDLKEQVPFILQERIVAPNGKVIERAIKIVLDATYNKKGELIAEDVKSWITKRNPTYILKRKLFKQRYPAFTFIET